jgi:NitT/TauT family transport system substrate-binding protein
MTEMMKRSAFIALGAATASSRAFVAPALAQAPSLTTLTIAQTTRSVQDWAVDVADKLGYFAANGLKVDVVIAGSSAAVAQQLAAGSAEIGAVSTTQVIEAILGGAPIVQVLKNVMTSPYQLVSRKGITSVEQLRGKTIMIGGPNDITRVFFDKVLAAHGLKSTDYTYTFAGAPVARYQALLAGAIDATPLLAPVSWSAIDQGYPLLDDTRKYFPNFPTSGYTAYVPWVTAHPAQMVAFARSVLQGVAWLYNPANKARAIAILSETTNADSQSAEKTYDQYTKQRLFSTNGRYEPAEFAQVVDMLVQTKQIPAAPPASKKIFEDTYVDEAARSLRTRR